MKMLHLLEKLQEEAYEANWTAERQPTALQAPKVVDPLLSDKKRLIALKADTARKQSQLKVKRELEAEGLRLAKATIALEEESMTNEELMKRDAEVYRLQVLCSKFCPEISPNWRVEAHEAFQSRYTPQKKL